MKNNKGKKKRETWIKLRHKVITATLRHVIGPYTNWKFGVDIEKFKQQGDRQYLVLLNHQTTFDQFFVGLAFRGPVYYMATEDIFSMGWISSLLRWVIAPIPIKKQTTDLQAVVTCMKVLKEGGTIAIAVEGNRTYSGKTEHINPAIVKMVKRMKVPVALFRIEGGYGVQPRWSDVVRKGKMRAYISEVLEPEQLAAMSEDEVLRRICDGLYVDDPTAGGIFRHKKNAEYMERAIYVCPDCGLSVFRSENDMVSCTKCGKKIRYQADMRLKGENCEFPFQTVTEWYEYQKAFINRLDVKLYEQEPMYRDQAKFFEVILYKNKQLIKEQISMALYGNRIVIDEGEEAQMVLPFEEVTAVSVLGRNKLNVYHNKKVYQFKGDKRFNALKYVNLYYRWKNVHTEGQDGGFLGL